MDDDTESPVPTSVTSETAPRDHTDTQRSLQQASAALEAAYRRIRQVRRNLWEVTDRIPSPELPTQPFVANDFGPEHNAIVLTGPSTDDLSSLDDESFGRSPATRAPPNVRATGRFRDLPPLNTAGMVNPILPNVQNFPYSSHRPYPLPRRSQLENQLSRRRDAQMDDASTSLGRRVAAREAAGASNHGPRSTLNYLSRFNGNSAQLLASIERDIERFRSIAEQRRLDPTPTTAPDSAMAPASTLSRSMDANATQRASSAQNASTSANGSLLGLHPESRRRRLTGGIYSARPSASTQSERLSLLSNFSVQNLPTPVSANPRPLIFEEPSSYIQAANFTPPENPWEDLIEEQDRRNYVIRRRYNADGEEHVHPINLEWMDEAPYGSTIVSRLRDPAHTGQNGGGSGGAQRRRGWARLDPDGNEIPSDEEEELERVRAEYRVQAQTHPRGPVFTRDGVDSHPGFHSLQAATTSTSLIPDEDTGISDSIPRVRLNVRDQQPFYGSVMDSVIHVDTVRREQCLPGPPAPFCANPLPMPIEEMVWSPPKRKPPRVTTIPKHASLAGR